MAKAMSPVGLDRQLGTDPPAVSLQCLRRCSREREQRRSDLLLAFCLVLRRLGPRRDARAALVFQTVALTRDLHHCYVMQNAVEHCGCQHGVTDGRLIPAAERQVAISSTISSFGIATLRCITYFKRLCRWVASSAMTRRQRLQFSCVSKTSRSAGTSPVVACTRAFATSHSQRATAALAACLSGLNTACRT